MKKILAIASLALVAVMLVGILCSCGSKVDSAIVGTWKNNSETVTFLSNGSGSVKDNSIGISADLKFTTKNGTIELTESLLGMSESMSGTYKVEGNTLTIVWSDGRTDVYTKQ